jgi:hypothetical protein
MMRSKTQIKNLRSQPPEEWSEPAYTEQGQLSDDLENILSWVSLDFVDIHHKSGMVTRYYHWEYECDWCGRYGHIEEHCPVKAEDEANLTDGDAET